MKTVVHLLLYGLSGLFYSSVLYTPSHRRQGWTILQHSRLCRKTAHDYDVKGTVYAASLPGSIYSNESPDWSLIVYTVICFSWPHVCAHSFMKETCVVWNTSKHIVLILCLPSFPLESMFPKGFSHYIGSPMWASCGWLDWTVIYMWNHELWGYSIMQGVPTFGFIITCFWIWKMNFPFSWDFTVHFIHDFMILRYCFNSICHYKEQQVSITAI